MNTTLSHSTTHPPDTEDRTVLQIPAPGELRQLALVDRLALRIGVWLLQRAQRPRTARPPHTADLAPGMFRGERYLTARESMTLLAYDMQRPLR